MATCPYAGTGVLALGPVHRIAPESERRVTKESKRETRHQ